PTSACKSFSFPCRAPRNSTRAASSSRSSLADEIALRAACSNSPSCAIASMSGLTKFSGGADREQPLRAGLRKARLGDLHQFVEHVRAVNRQLAERLAIERHVGFGQAVNELRIANAARPARRRHTHNPQRAEVSLLGAAIAEGEGAGPKHGFGGHLDEFAALSPIALHFPEEPLARLAPRVTFSRSHSLNLFFVESCVCRRRRAAPLIAITVPVPIRGRYSWPRRRR